MSIVIGEGAAGCVHKPSLECKNKKIDYKNKVSKLMDIDNANDELDEYKLISKLDKNKDFYLGKPVSCLPAKTKKNLKAINLCEDFDSQDINDYKLLLLKDGGNNLKELGKKYSELSINSNNTKKVELFFIEAHRLLFALKVFLDNNILHHDLKPQNIVYNEDTNRINIIDFGFMMDKKKILKDLKLSKYKHATFHWNWPFELVFLNKNNYVKIANKSTEEKAKFFNELKDSKYLNVKDKMKLFYQTTCNDKNFIKLNSANFLSTIINLNNDEYENFIIKCINTLDIYGVGISLMYVLQKSEHLLKKNLFIDLEELFKEMISAAVFTRPNIDILLNKYENILEYHSMLKKYKLYFKNHKIREVKNSILNVFDKFTNTISKSKLSTNKIKEIESNDKDSNFLNNRSINKSKKKRNKKYKKNVKLNITKKSPYK